MPASHSVLIVEDEPLIAMMLEDFLDTLGHKVAGTVESVEEAMARIDAGGFEVAILDVQLKNGERVWPVADRLATEGKPFVLATGGHVQAPAPRNAAVTGIAQTYKDQAIAAGLAAALRGYLLPLSGLEPMVLEALVGV